MPSLLQRQDDPLLLVRLDLGKGRDLLGPPRWIRASPLIRRRSGLVRGWAPRTPARPAMWPATRQLSPGIGSAGHVQSAVEDVGLTGSRGQIDGVCAVSDPARAIPLCMDGSSG